MNRHRTFWSAMGAGLPSESEAKEIQEARKIQRKQDKEDIKRMIELNTTFLRHGKHYVIELLKEIIEESEDK